MKRLVNKVYSSKIIPKIYSSYEKAWMRFSTNIEFGTNIYDREWDLLVVLDTCRVDALQKLAPDYDFINDVGSIWSVGSSTPEWTVKTFTEDNLENIQKTAYIVSSGYAGYVLRDRIFHPNKDLELELDWGVVRHNDFKYYEESWEAGEQIEGYPVPSNTTERAIDVGREICPERTIVHYFSPHSPFTYRAIKYRELMREYEKNPFSMLREGNDIKSEVWKAYIEQTRLVLDSVEKLIENFDAENVVITADHGEAFGEAGFIEHRAGMLHPVVKKVPWVETTAGDTKSIKPSVESVKPTERVESEIKQSLEDLGYM